MHILPVAIPDPEVVAMLTSGLTASLSLEKSAQMDLERRTMSMPKDPLHAFVICTTYFKNYAVSDRHGMNGKDGRGIPISTKPSTYRHRRGSPQDINGEKVSVPTTTFTSPTLSPKRFSTVDIFDSAFNGQREFNFSPPCVSSSRRNQLHSPPLQSPYMTSKGHVNVCAHLPNNKSPLKRVVW
ncbi:hypothetical protein Tco_0096600 [Tanacetum coccineum]